jgi:hypothetical protein
VQIDWMMDAVRAVAGDDIELAALEALKFKQPMRPGQVVRLRVDVLREPSALQFRFWTGATVFSSGRGRLRPGGRAG